MKTFNKTILAVLATGLISCALFSQQAQAVPVNGSITFAGTVDLNTASAGTATAVLANGWHGVGGVGSPTVQSSSGSFAGLSGMNTTFTNLQWNFNSGAINAFWSVGGFTFNLTSSAIFSQGGFPAGVTVQGTGTIVGNGFDPTPGTWSFSTQDPSAGNPPVFSFSAASGSTGQAPDGGSTVALLGCAIFGVEVLRRKLRTAK